MAKKILVVDDDRNIGQILHASFSAKGYETLVSRNGEDALTKFEETKPDLILLDVLLPKMNGWEVCTKIKESELGAKTPVILMSAIYKNPKMQMDAKQKYGADDFIEKPFQLSKLLSSVVSLIGEGESEALEDSDSEEAPKVEEERKVIMSGDMTTVSFPELLHDVYVMGKTGVLTVSHDDIKKEISIRDGYPVSVATNIEKEYFGNYLVRMRKITKDECAESLERMKESNRLQGTILIEMGAISPQELVNYLKLQMREKIFEIFSWRNGTFEFMQDSSVTGDISAIDMSTANVIFAGIKAHFDLDYSMQQLDPYFTRYLRMGTNQYYRFQDLELTPSESKLLLEIDGTKTVDDLVGMSLLAPLQTYHLILTLLLSGMCEAVSEAADEPDRFFESAMEGEAEEPPTRIIEQPQESEVAESVSIEPEVEADEATTTTEKTEEKPEPVPLAQTAPEPASEASEDEGAKQRRKIQEKFEQIQDSDFFVVLGVGKKPTEHEVRIAYHRLAKEYHPDKFFGNVSPEMKRKVEDIFRTITKAYEKLNTQEKINSYVKFLEGQQPEEEKEGTRLEGVKKILLAEQHFQNGLNFLKERRYTRAADAFAKAIEISMNESEFIAHYGWALYNMPDEKDLDEEELAMRGNESDADLQFQGRENLNRAISINPRTEKAYLFLGQIYKGQGLKEFAERQFEKALICNPNSIQALRELRLLKLEDQKKEKKKGFFDKLFNR